ncbi:hypothetical protein KUCAC02_015275, partial [Chaenocephalus aceratus]
MAKRRYKEEFLNIGFTKAVRNGEERPQCVLCGEVLSNESMKINKLDRHLQTKHPLHRDKSKDFFICKEESFKKQCFDGGKAFKGNRGALRASYQVSLHIAKAKKPHSIGEQLIKPCLKDVRLSVLGEDAANKIEEALASKALQQDLGEVLDVVVRVVNLIKKRPLQSRLFRELCKEMGAEHEHLLFHCEVRWLSKGKVLQRVWELREQVMAYLKNENANLVKHFEDKRWLARFAYLVDIFNKLNMLNTSLQGKENSILDLEDGIQGFQARLGLWHSQLENFKRYFPDSQRAQNLQWVKFPFQAVPSQDLGLSQAELEALVTLQVNRGSCCWCTLEEWPLEQKDQHPDTTLGQLN